jgi:hypothetical protein
VLLETQPRGSSIHCPCRNMNLATASQPKHTYPLGNRNSLWLKTGRKLLNVEQSSILSLFFS